MRRTARFEIQAASRHHRVVDHPFCGITSSGNFPHGALMVLPAHRQARGPSSNHAWSAQNSLRNLGLANDERRRPASSGFPPPSALRGVTRTAASKLVITSWVVDLLPWIDHSDLHILWGIPTRQRYGDRTES